MCTELYIRKESLNGEVFKDLPGAALIDPPVLCGCWYGEEPVGNITQEELDELHRWLMKHLAPFLLDGRFGNIIIEVR